MGSISGLSSSMGGASGLRGIGGLASGMDRDSLIENMTYATRSKIAQQNQKKQTLEWKQAAMRSITSKMFDFSNKYTSFASSTNLTGSKLFSRTQISAAGDNSKYLSVSGTGTASSTLSVLGVKQLAQNAQVSTVGKVSNQSLTTGKMETDADGKLTGDVDVSLISGRNIEVKYGSKTYYIPMNSAKEYDYSSPESTAKAINDAMKEISIGNDRSLADVMKLEFDAGTKQMSFKNNDAAGNSIEIVSGSGDVLKSLGFAGANENWSELPKERRMVTSAGLTGVNEAKVKETKQLYQVLSGKDISFSYNGTTKKITLGSCRADSTIDDLKKDLQDKLDQAFGKNRVQVDLNVNNTNTEFDISFKTVKPLNPPVTNPDGTVKRNEEDTSSTLAITGAERDLLGNMGIFGIEAGASNRLNMTSAIKDSGLANPNNAVWDSNGEMKLVINDQEITIKQTQSISEIMNTINNNTKMKVTVSYQSNSDRFVISSNERGGSGDITLKGEGAKLLFGTETGAADSGQYLSETVGRDAVMFVQYAGMDKPTMITRDSNTISVDGLSISVKGTFGYSDTTCQAPIDSTQTVTFDAQVDADNTAKVVKEMIAAYNEMLELVNKEVGQKPNRNYQPLTDEQKEEMSEEQIKKWEEEAKKGLFFNNSDFRTLTDKMRSILPSQDKAALSRMGISVSTDYSDNGKLVFDEELFKTALKSDPEAVREVFTRTDSKDSNGKKIEGGLMTKMKNVMDQYSSMTGLTKGIFVEQAGSVHSPTSILTNDYQKQMDSLDKYIVKLTDQLKMEQNRYISQFSRLETLVSQMNSQSSYLSGMTGGL